MAEVLSRDGEFRDESDYDFKAANPHCLTATGMATVRSGWTAFPPDWCAGVRRLSPRKSWPTMSVSLTYAVKLPGTNRSALMQITDPEHVHLELMKQCAELASEVLQLKSEVRESRKGGILGRCPFSLN